MKTIISIIVPCRNEEKFIGQCLEAIIKQDYPKDNLEVLVVDGMSQDRTREIVKQYSQEYPFIKLLDNPKKFTPFALNIGIKQARGDIIARLDSHAGYREDYLSKCLKYLKEYQADNIGGVIRTLPMESTLIAQAIAFCLSSFFGAGDSYFRTGSKEPKWVDTVFGGCYKKEVFNKIGLFDERLIRSQDIEFNKRLKAAGGKTLLVPEIKADYYAQPTFGKFLKHNFTDGFWAIYPLRFKVRFFSLRHLIPSIFVISLLVTMVFGFFFFWLKVIFILIFFSYLLANLFFSVKIALKKGVKYILVLPFVFANRHFAYGLGSLTAFIRIYGKQEGKRS